MEKVKFLYIDYIRLTMCGTNERNSEDVNAHTGNKACDVSVKLIRTHDTTVLFAVHIDFHRSDIRLGDMVSSVEKAEIKMLEEMIGKWRKDNE